MKRDACFGWIAALIVLLTTGRAQAVEPSQDGAAFFEKNVRPLLVEHCYGCHSSQAKRLRGGLYLDREQGWLRGGDLGPAVQPRDPEASLLISAVRYGDENLKMPPRGKLTDAQIAILTQWVGMGAPGPHAEQVASRAERRTPDREFWAFRPPADRPSPAVRHAAWATNGLDRFILAALVAKNLAPAPEADRRTLIRRATFDLTGLPPTPEEIHAFLDDRSPDAFERVVDRLLASPQYGERWGRHWLDVARYADSNGLDENVAHGNAWRYRDYVIDSFNADKPYDQFVVEQLAGDLLPSSGMRNERLIATGFLSLGPKVLAEPDETKMEMDIVDEQVDTVGRAFLGLTLGCARCHDHKFDPIPTTDYYGLAGIFRSTRTMETFKKVARWYENSLASEADLKQKAAQDQKVAVTKKAIEEVIAKATAEIRARDKANPDATVAEARFSEQAHAKLKSLRAELTVLEKAAPELPTAMGVSEGKVADVRVHIRGSHLTLGAAVPRRFPQVLCDETPATFSAGQSGRLELARWIVRPEHPLTSRVMVNRIWRWHFGHGLVGTPDNFGALGERPSHPQLLDWLARRFAESGWSVKAMHRLIMLSSTYRMSSRDDPQAARIDPENRLLWRANVRRLEAEEIRDSLLAVAGTLDTTMGGSLIEVKNRAYFFDHTSRDTTKYDSHRRAVYLPVVRNHLYEMFQLFDAPDPSVAQGNRATTTVAPQALFVLNSELVLQASRELAADLLDRCGRNDAMRLRELYERAYGRPPSDEELRRTIAYLERFEQIADGETSSDHETRLRAWQALCQVIVAANEFLFIR